MKKTLFVKFLFLLLCGSVLTTAGCKDYDDDIDALRNDVEDLKGAVVELNGFENRIAALERTQAAFEAIDFSGFAKKSDRPNSRRPAARSINGWAMNWQFIWTR